MRHKILYAIALPIISFILVITLDPAHVYGKAPQTMPHLIQTVSEQDIFEGMLALGLLETPVLVEDDCDKAYENVKACVVRINMGNAYGSGVIWEMTSEKIVIATNKHVLEFWDEQVSNVLFPQGSYASAELLGISEEYDLGFLTEDNKELDYMELEQLRYVHFDMNVYNEMKEGDEIFCVGATGRHSEGVENVVQSNGIYLQGTIGNMWQYIEEFEEYMIYGYGYGTPGISGGGTFDPKGNFIGMISGGTMDGERASVPLTIIVEAYAELTE